jgi:NAD-dependent deacetylase
MAGSECVIELHGSIHRNYCEKCRKFFSLDYIMDSAEKVPVCDTCGGIVKPDVVLYEESLSEEAIYNSIEAISKADTLIVGGTSLAVYPAAGLLHYFKGKHLILINKSSTPYDRAASLVIKDSIGKVLKSILD